MTALPSAHAGMEICRFDYGGTPICILCMFEAAPTGNNAATPQAALTVYPVVLGDHHSDTEQTLDHRCCRSSWDLISHSLPSTDFLIHSLAHALCVVALK